MISGPIVVEEVAENRAKNRDFIARFGIGNASIDGAKVCAPVEHIRYALSYYYILES